MSLPKADVCLLVEGAYPYVRGGVSSWLHQLIQEQSHLTFHLVSLVAKHPTEAPVFDTPSNLLSLNHVVLQEPVQGNRFFIGEKRLCQALEPCLKGFLTRGGLFELQELMAVLQPVKKKVGRRQLLNSSHTWEMLLRIYNDSMPDTSFLNFFWTCRAILSGLYSTLLTPLPPASAYHAISTGYAGLLVARAKLETGASALITEHGIYTNERRIELTMADWLYEGSEHRYAIDSSQEDLVSLWMNAFESYARSCYQACDRITTLYRGNQVLQFRDGADPGKAEIIPNGVNITRFSDIPRCSSSQRKQTVALIGRVVSIKDVKTFIRAAGLLKNRRPDVQFWLLGPTDEEPDYYAECETLVNQLGLVSNFEFKGQVQLTEYLGKLDCIVLTSVSEAQPLVILEAGAAGVPVVSTDVGSCREMLEGTAFPEDDFGQGGYITDVAAPLETCNALDQLLADDDKRARYGESLRLRVEKYYNADLISQRYAGLYEEAIRLSYLPEGARQWRG